MQKIMLWLIALLFFRSNYAMNEKSLWVQTIDKKKWFVDTHTITSSNLLTTLREKYSGSHNDPLIVPLTSTLLKCYWCYNAISTQKLHARLSSDKYFQLIDAAEKLKALTKYLHLITEIFPRENEKKISNDTLHGHITRKWVGHLLIGSAIKNQHVFYTFPEKKLHHNKTQCLNIINKNGTYVIHNFCNESKKPKIKLYNTQTKKNKSLHPSKENQRVYLSPDNNYILIVDLYQGIYLYHISTKQKDYFYAPYNEETDIIISDDSKYILMRQLLPFNDYTIRYQLWHIDDDMKSQEVNSDNDYLSASKSAIFHPDNKHIFHLKEGKLYLYDIANKTDSELNPFSCQNPKKPNSDLNSYSTPISRKKDFIFHGNKKANRELNPSGSQSPRKKDFIFYDDLVMSQDKKHLISKVKTTRNTSLSDDFNYIVLDIQNMKNTLLPPSKEDSLPPVCIPHKDLIAYCSGDKKLLQLLNKKKLLVASHIRKESYISALASDKNGDHLACGYTDGLIVLWDISQTRGRICNKKIVRLNVPIRHMVFTDNQLLFAHSKSTQLMPTKNPGQAALWDMQGNEIIDFGNSIFDAHINQNGSFITIIKTDMQSRKSVKNLTLTCYNLKPDLPGLTLKQAYKRLHPEIETKKES